MLAYTDKSGINKKIGLACIFSGQHKAIKKFLGTNKISIIYMKELERF